ncbi:MAG TPA: X2-like carbohydrate binding domain-containing protein [Clostridia bacterium]|nr:X2-like carbohydrate binding domain-containing protein [Clostridia bacterium]
MKKIRNTFLILLMFVLTVAGLTFALSENESEVAQAANTTSVTIMGENITTRVDLAVLFSEVDGDFEGFASFEDGVLTLENVKIQFIYTETSVINALDGDLEIVFVGENYMDNSAYDEATVIKLDNGSLTLSGEGSLSINSVSTPIVVLGGDITFDCTHVELQNSNTSIRLDGSRYINFKKGSMTKIQGGNRAISNLLGETFLNDRYEEGCGIKTGSSEENAFPNSEYTGERYVFVFTNAELSSTNIEFDKYRPSSIIVTMTLNGNTFQGINALNLGVNYSVSGNTVTLYENCYSDRPLGGRTLQFIFSPGTAVDFTVQVVDTTPTTSVNLSINSSTYNADFARQIETTISQPAKFQSVSNISANDYNYDYSSGRFVFNEAYVAGLSNGEYRFVFSFSGGAFPKTFTLTVINSVAGFDPNPPTGNNSYISPVAAVFDKYTAKPEYAPLIIDIIYNGNSLTSIKNGLDTISYKYFIKAEAQITIVVFYLNTLEVGNYSLTFNFSDGEAQVLTLIVKNTDPLPDNKTPYYEDPLVRMDIPGLGGGTIDDSLDNDSGSSVPEIIDGNGDTAALIIIAIFSGVGVLSCVVWIILRKKRIV